MSSKKRGLGRGLSELGLSELLTDISDKAPKPPVANEYTQLPIDQLCPGEYQPRKHISNDALMELAESIKVQGIIQPIVVRRKNDDLYEIIAGERRWRAAGLAGLDNVPVIIRNDINDEAALAISLIENIQRKDLNIIEEANALQRLIEEFSMTHQAVADAVGKSRTAVTNILRLLKLNEDVRGLVEQGHLDMGHARALLVLEGVEQSEVANIIVARKLTVRETERLIKRLGRKTQQLTKDVDQPIEVGHLQQKIATHLQAKVKIICSDKGKGKIIIHYNGLDHLDDILEKVQ